MKLHYPARNLAAVPPHSPGMRIGLFGGTFDPPHRAHLGASLLAMKRLRLDRVWWLVTPGNPLKNTSGLAPLPDRIEASHMLAHHPRIDISGLESVINTRYTFDTISWLIRRCPGTCFVWIMGADNLRSFHRWQRWRDIARLVPIVVVDRLGPSLYAAASPAANAFAYARVPDSAAAGLPLRKAPAWTFLHGLKSSLSSTALRALRKRRRPASTKVNRATAKHAKTAKPKKTATKAAKSKTSRSKTRHRKKPGGKGRR